MPSRQLVLPGCLALAVASSVAVWASERQPESAPALSSVASQQSMPRGPVDVSLDPSGRPYDVAFPREATVERRHLAFLHAPSRKVRFMGGESIGYAAPGEEAVVLEERPGRRYPVYAVWAQYNGGVSQIVGVMIVERATPVARWRELDRVAYGTDAGTGGIATVEVALAGDAAHQELGRRWEKDLIDEARESFVADVDGAKGIDSIVFANGFGDGGFPSVAGYDASGRRAAIVLWSMVAPWRLAFPEGKPPRQVTNRENALAACLAGRRKVDGARCRVAR